ncbi:helix-turn-helix domain-containing protein [Armatimonas sp.]|uniref:helix-turn-helix domain-containing protein n=1 Tax=Armatimonas sp. TaxID=1872638 RepID=UPI00286C0785|nr:helix-turn-helix domain-containing protein [Armatimonas sp.]
MKKENKAEIIFHPVRIRVVQALFGERQMTAHELQTATGVASLATLYRHLNRMVEAEILAVVEERPVRGAIEKVYAFAHGSVAKFQPEEYRAIPPEDQLRYFNALVGSLLNDFGRYVGQKQFDRGEDGVITRQIALNLTDEEAKQLWETLYEALAPYQKLALDPARRRRILTTILLPVVEQVTEEETP